MKRNYKNFINVEDIIYFSGFEIENTPAKGFPTLFVVGARPVMEIQNYANQVSLVKGRKEYQSATHVYLGANQSFEPNLIWDSIIDYLLADDFWVTLDFTLRDHWWVLEHLSDEVLNHHKFIPQVAIQLPYLKNYNYNCTLKIDDSGFALSNPGVWCHPLTDLLKRENYTHWDEYQDDQILLTRDDLDSL